MKSKENSNMLLRKHDLDRMPERILSSIKSTRQNRHVASPCRGSFTECQSPALGKVDTWRQPVAGTLPSVGRGPSAKIQTMLSACR